MFLNKKVREKDFLLQKLMGVVTKHIDQSQAQSMISDIV
jgi:hypothetical protein